MTRTQPRHDAHAGLGPGSDTNLILYPRASYGDAGSWQCAIRGPSSGPCQCQSSQWLHVRQDGKLNWLKAKVDKAEAEAAKSPSDETAKALGEAKTDFENYMKLVRQGGY